MNSPFLAEPTYNNTDNYILNWMFQSIVSM